MGIIGLENQFSVFWRVAVLHRFYFTKISCDYILYLYYTTQGEEQEGDSGPSDDEGGEQVNSVEDDQPDSENTDLKSEVCTFQAGIQHKWACLLL